MIAGFKVRRAGLAGNRLGWAGVVLAVQVMAGAALAGDPINVLTDQAKLVRLPEGTLTIVVGNPAIADVSVQKSGIVVITGRAAGQTNFIALDRSGAIISESQVVVSVATAGRVLVQRGSKAASYHCASECLPVPGLGDDVSHFVTAMGMAQARAKDAREAAAVSGLVLPPAAKAGQAPSNSQSGSGNQGSPDSQD